MRANPLRLEPAEVGLGAEPASRSRRCGRWTAVTLTTAAMLLCGVFPVVVTVMLGGEPYHAVAHGFPGFSVAVTTALLSAVAQLGEFVSIGAMVHLLFLGDGPSRRMRVLPEGVVLRLLQLGSAVWALAALGLVPFEMLDANGAPLSALGDPYVFGYMFPVAYAPTAWAMNMAAAFVVLFAAFFASLWTGLLVPLCLALLGILAPVVTGQVLVGPDHDYGSDAAIVQTVVAAVFFGAILVAGLQLATGRFVAPLALRRLFQIGCVALPVVAASDVVIALFSLRLGGLTGSVSGWLTMAGWLSLAPVVVAQLVGFRMWRRGRLRARAVTVLMATAATGVIGWAGVSVAQTRQPPPQFFVPTSIQQNFVGFDVPDPPTWWVLATQWRVSLLFTAVAVAAVVGYLAALRAVRRAGGGWPAGRTAAWIAGWAVVVVATSSGIGTYSASDFAVHMVAHMLLDMIAPMLLVLGGVVTLTLQATRPARRDEPAGLHEWVRHTLRWGGMRVLYNPLLVFVVYIGASFLLYLTPTFQELMRFHWGHRLMDAFFPVAGYLFYGLLIGVDPVPRPMPHIGKLGYVLAAMPFQAVFAVIVMTRTGIIADTFYRYLATPWANLPLQQYIGGGVDWAGGEIPLIAIMIMLSVQWRREDARAGRARRSTPSGGDADPYRQMLQRLTRRDAARPSLGPEISDKEPHP